MMLLLTQADIERAVSVAEAIEAVEGAFAALSRGEAEAPAPLLLWVRESNGEVHVKTAHIRGESHYAVKLISSFYDNPDRALPVNSGLSLVLSATTGRPEALLFDNALLTHLRTGAAGAVAAKYLAKRSLEKVAILGAGTQARFQLRALAEVRGIPRVAVWARRPERAAAYAQEMRAELDVLVETAVEVEQAVRGADLLITATLAQEPLVRVEWLSPGVHITAMGADVPEKQELEGAVLARADLVFADYLPQCLKQGEIHRAVAAGVLRAEDVAGELGDLVTGRVAGRTRDDQVTVCDLTGVGVQDTAIAVLALRKAAALGLGVTIRPG